MKKEYYFTKTSGGSNKEYRIVVDLEWRSVTSTWGRIGGHMTTRTLTFSTIAAVEECVSGKRSRRLAHGYVEHSVDDFSSPTYAEMQFDVSDLVEAERSTRL